MSLLDPPPPAGPAPARSVRAQRAATLALAVVGLLARALARASPRDPRLVAVGSCNDRFADNSRYFFLAALERTDIRVVWISGDEEVCRTVRALGGVAHRRRSLRGVATLVRAGWYVFSCFDADIDRWLGAGARTFNLWHGIPIKAIQRDITGGPQGAFFASPPWSPVRLTRRDLFAKPDLLLSTSPTVTACFTSAFDIPAERCPELGYPRNDHLFAPGAAAAARALLGLPVDATGILGYFPTWRDDYADFLTAAGFSFERLNDRLAAAGRTLVYKPHPHFRGLQPAQQRWSNLIVLDRQIDLNEVLAACDALITDHSSVVFDYLLLDRPVAYFVPDRERYESQRNTYFSFDELAVGPIATTAEELEDLVATLPLDGPPDPRVAALRQRLWAGYAGGASQAVGDLIAAQVAAAPARLRPLRRLRRRVASPG